MDSGYKNDVIVESSVQQASDVDFQPEENCNVKKNLFENNDDGDNGCVSESVGYLEDKMTQTCITETKDLNDVHIAMANNVNVCNLGGALSPKIKHCPLENDLTKHKPIYQELDLESDVCSDTDNTSEYDNVHYLPCKYEEACIKCKTAEEIFKHCGVQSNSTSSMSSGDAPSSESDDEDDNLKKSSIQSDPKNKDENGLIKENADETKITSSPADDFRHKGNEENQLPQIKDETETNISSQSEAKMVKNFNISNTFHKSRVNSTTHSTKSHKNMYTTANNKPENNNFVKRSFVPLTDPVKTHDSKMDNKSPENVEVVKPDEETAAKIMNRVEFYFTDFNILKNNFLLKHTRKNKEGYVSVKLVTSFRKVKAITKDWRVVAYSLTNSKILKLNPEKTKVCRIEPIPKIENTSFGKTIVVFNLPFQNPSSEQLKELFGKFGNIVHAEILSSKSKNYNLYHRKCLFFNRDVSSSSFGVVEFESYTDAQKALKDEEGYLPKENKMVVVPLVAKYYKFRPKRSFRYKSTISYPKNAYGRYYPKSEYAQDIYAVNNPNSAKYGQYYYYDEPLPRSNFAYRPNYGYYSQHSDPRNFYGKQNMIPNNVSSSKIGSKYCGGNRYTETWRQNRYLKANTSMNIDKRLAPSDRKM